MIAIVLAGPIGYLAPNHRAGLVIYLLVWAIALPIQTVVVHNENPDDINAAYPVVNALILAGGVAVNRLGSAMGERRRRRRFA